MHKLTQRINGGVVIRVVVAAAFHFFLKMLTVEHRLRPEFLLGGSDVTGQRIRYAFGVYYSANFIMAVCVQRSLVLGELAFELEKRLKQTFSHSSLKGQQTRVLHVIKC